MKNVVNFFMFVLVIVIVMVLGFIGKQLHSINNNLGLIAGTNIAANIELRREAEQARQVSSFALQAVESQQSEFDSYLRSRGIFTGYYRERKGSWDKHTSKQKTE